MTNNILFMAKNISVSKVVMKSIDEQPCIRSSMSRGLINIRALAKYLIKEININAPIDAVMSAIRRYDIKPSDKIFENAFKIISKSSNISTKSPISVITLIKDAEVQELIPQIFSIVHYSRGDVLRIIQANKSIKILVDEKNIEKIEKIFPKNKIINIRRNLAEINIYIHPDGYDKPGTIAVLSNALAINNVAILENVNCFPEWICFVDEKDILKAYDILNRLRQLKPEHLKKIE